MRRSCLALLAVFGWPLAGCQAPAAPPDDAGPVAREVRAAAARNRLPPDLVLAVAAVEGGLTLPALRVIDPGDHVPVAGALELRHGAFDSLARGAALLGTDEATLRVDRARGTEAGARVLAELARANGVRGDDLAGDLAPWRAALATLSGLGDAAARAAYATSVLTLVRDGAVVPARDGERVVIAAHPGLDVGEPAPVDARNLATPAATTDTPDFPGALWLTTDCTNKCTPGRPDGDAAVDTIVIHDTEGGWTASVATLQNDSGVSVHYLVDADGSRVAQFRHESDTTWHAGNFEYNKHSVGIEHVGFVADKNGYAAALYDKSVALVKSIRGRWHVPLDRAHIIGHYQVPDGAQIGESAPPCSATLDACETSANYGGSANHRDPGYHWQWCQYMEKLGGACTCNDAYSLWNCTTDHAEAVRCQGGRVQIDHCAAGCLSQPLGVDDVCQGGTGGVTVGDGGPGGGEPGSDGGAPGDDGGTHLRRIGGGCAIEGGGNGEGDGGARGDGDKGAALLVLGLALVATWAGRARPARR